MAIVSYTYGDGEMPKLTEEQKQRLQALAERPDSEIDYSDIPPMSDEELAGFMPWQEAERIRAERRMQSENFGVQH